jgi:acetylornithine/succinyldiaminopimelate/putrescine aminotransferase
MWQKIKEQMGLGAFSEYERVLLPTTREKLEVMAADGCRVKTRRDGEEKWVVDATSQVGTNPLGHRDDEMMAAMKEFYESDLPLMVAGNDSFHPLQRELVSTPASSGVVISRPTTVTPGRRRLNAAV